jgi:hypothetical protein
MVGSFEHDIETFGCMKGGELLTLLIFPVSHIQ